MSFQKGHKLNLGNKYRLGISPWNKGLVGVCKVNSGSIKKGERVSPKTEFKKGLVPWNKGEGDYISGEKNHFFGKKHTVETLEKMRLAKLGIKGEETNRWKGGWHKSQRRIFDINSKGSFTKKDWLWIKEKYNSMCLCCKRQEPEIKLSADHVIPISAWPSWIESHPEIKYRCGDVENIQPLCMECNLRKFISVIDYRPQYENVK